MITVKTMIAVIVMAALSGAVAVGSPQDLQVQSDRLIGQAELFVASALEHDHQAAKSHSETSAGAETTVSIGSHLEGTAGADLSHHQHTVHATGLHTNAEAAKIHARADVETETAAHLETGAGAELNSVVDGTIHDTETGLSIGIWR